MGLRCLEKVLDYQRASKTPVKIVGFSRNKTDKIKETESFLLERHEIICNGFPTIYDLIDVDPRVLFISTPSDLHLSHGRAVIKENSKGAKLNSVYIEKPLSVIKGEETLEEAIELVKVADEKGILFGFGTQYSTIAHKILNVYRTVTGYDDVKTLSILIESNGSHKREEIANDLASHAESLWRYILKQSIPNGRISDIFPMISEDFNIFTFKYRNKEKICECSVYLSQVESEEKRSPTEIHFNEGIKGKDFKVKLVREDIDGEYNLSMYCFKNKELIYLGKKKNLGDPLAKSVHKFLRAVNSNNGERKLPATGRDGLLNLYHTAILLGRVPEDYQLKI